MSGGRRRGRPARGEGKKKCGKANKKEFEDETKAGARELTDTQTDEEDIDFSDLGTSKLAKAAGNKGKGKMDSVDFELDEANVVHSPVSNREKENINSNLARSPRSGKKWSDTVEDEEQYPLHHSKVIPAEASRTSWAEVVQGGEGLIKCDPPEEIEGKKMGELQIEEVEEAKNYWGNVLVCKVIGGYPPFMVMSGFLTRVWKGRGLEKVWQMDRGVFMARFITKN